MSEEKNTALEKAACHTISQLLDCIFQKFDDLKSKQNLKEALQEYFLYFYKNNIYVNSMILSESGRSILDVYQPLTIYNLEEQTETYFVCSEDITFLDKHKNILLVDSAGMGKSTLIKYLSIQLLLKGNVLPIIIELRNMEGKNIVDYIKHQIEPIDKEIREKDLIKLLQKGGFAFFFDGYDEIEDVFKKTISKKIRYFVNKTIGNYFVISSREEKGLCSFGNFKRFGICALQLWESKELIKKLDKDNGELAAYIIDKIEKEKNFVAIRELLSNPLLVSILYKTFECGYCGEIPYKKIEFYTQIYYALFDRHDRTKEVGFVHEKKSLLDCSDFYSVLRRLGFHCLESKKIEYPIDDFYHIIDNTLQEMSWLNKTTKEGVAYDLTHTVPYLREYNISVEWIHKSFIEFFAASFIMKDIFDKGDVFELLLKKPYEYYNILDFCLELDIRSFRINVIFPLLEKYLKKYEEDSEKLEVRAADYNYRESFLLQYEAKISVINEKDIELPEEKIILKTIGTPSEFWVNTVMREQRLIIISRTLNEWVLLKLLYENNIDIFSYKKDYITNIDYIKKTPLKDGVYNIDLKTNNTINSHALFLSINSLLDNALKVYVLDYLKCKMMYEEICESIKEDNGGKKYNL